MKKRWRTPLIEEVPDACIGSNGFGGETYADFVFCNCGELCIDQIRVAGTVVTIAYVAWTCPDYRWWNPGTWEHRHS